jgi:glucose-6-phosphate 1-dehydrogenase
MGLKKIPSYLMIVIGGTGDLARKGLLPALCRVKYNRFADFYLLGVGTGRVHNDETYRDFVYRALVESGDADRISRDSLDWIFYQAVGAGRLDDYKHLAERLIGIETKFQLEENRIFYLATPPNVFSNSIQNLGELGLNLSKGETKLVIEKPFGQDFNSACELNQIVHKFFEESQIYRIDHYLGKETVQNLLAFRFSNAMFESLWNRDRVERVEITVAETIGVEHRAGYYDKVGAMRDMIQNHLTQLLTLVAMEVPTTLESEGVRHEKVKVIKAISPITPADVVYGQYTKGTVDGVEVVGYTEEPNIPSSSQTETYAAVRLNISNWRWQGVPFILRTGKRLYRGISEIGITFRKPPVSVFRAFNINDIDANKLIITLQPGEGFDLRFKVKQPGEPYKLLTQSLQYKYPQMLGGMPGAYETLILDVVSGDQTLFVRADEAEASWELYTPLLSMQNPVYKYASGTWGPMEAQRLLDGEKWLTI